MGGASAPPISEVVVIAPRARPRSGGGNQWVTTRAAFGNAPASPAPKRKRMSTSDDQPKAAPVSAVKIDQQTTIRAITPRDPKRSPQCPIGTSNRQYARMKAL